LRGDPIRLRQVLINLIGNAIKYTEQGSVKLGVEAVEGDEHRCILRFTVEDTGVGIDDEAQKEIFNAFSQVGADSRMEVQGTGLGLSITRELVRLMRGEIGVASERGVGSTFWFSVPFVAMRDQRATPRLPDDQVYGMNVLLVNSNLKQRQHLSQLLTSWMLNCNQAVTGKQAMELLRNANKAGMCYPLVMVDEQLSDMSGIDLIDAIEKSPDIQLPRFILSVMDSEGVANLSGQTVLLAKPTRASQLYDSIISTMHANATGEQSGSMEKQEGLCVSDVGASVLLAEDNPINSEIAMEMLSGLGCSVHHVEDGMQAVAILQRQRFDAVLMDCQMPELDGLQTTQQIRDAESQGQTFTRNAGLQRIPVIALTANAMEGDREACLAAGMDDYLSKPFTKQQLSETLLRWLDIHNLPAGERETGERHTPAEDQPDQAEALPGNASGESMQAREPETPVSGVGKPVVAPVQKTKPSGAVKLPPKRPMVEERASGAVLDQKALENIRVLQRSASSGVFEKVVKLYIQDAEKVLAAMHDAVVSQDTGELGRLVHRLRASSANLGATQLTDALKEMDKLTRSGTLEGLESAVRQIEKHYAAVRTELERELEVSIQPV
jgi:CheY-like chemotaxis protein